MDDLRRPALRDIEHALAEAPSYEVWLEAAEAHDAATGAAEWRHDDASPYFDAEELRQGMFAMRQLRADADAEGMAAHLTDDLYRHLNALLAPELFAVALAGTKRIAETYLDEAETSLRWLATVPGVPASHLLGRFERAWHVFGRTALLLSGGATWGFHHLGVCRALFELDLLPHVLCGASTGAMIAAGICARDDAELAAMFADPVGQIRLDGLRLAPLDEAVQRRALLDPEQLRAVLDHNIGTPTFAEAHRRSGRELAISVSPTRHRQKARLLSHLTAPDVLLTSAVLASSALPGLFPPVQLERRMADGTVLPHVPGERWVDGSIAGDLPKRRLSRLHNVNHFVVSQTNPHIVPFVRHHGRRGLASAVMRVVGATARSQGMWATELVQNLTGRRPVVGRLAAAVNAVFSQDYRGHADIHPRFRWGLLARIVTNPTPDDLLAFIDEGARSVWPRVGMIRQQTRIGRAFREEVARLRRPDASGSPPEGRDAVVH